MKNSEGIIFSLQLVYDEEEITRSPALTVRTNAFVTLRCNIQVRHKVLVSRHNLTLIGVTLTSLQIAISRRKTLLLIVRLRLQLD
jgi:hypothetical protein